MELLQRVFSNLVGGVRGCGFLALAREIREDHPSQEAKGVNECYGRGLSRSGAYLLEPGDISEPDRDPHRFRPPELCPRTHPARVQGCWKDLDHNRSLEGVRILLPKYCVN